MSEKEVVILLHKTDIERIALYLNEGTEDIDDILIEICAQVDEPARNKVSIS